MRGLAADHAAERDKAVEIRLPMGDPDGLRHLQRARHLDGFMRRRDGLQLGPCAGQQRIRDVAIERRANDQQLQRPVEGGSRQRVFGPGHRAYPSAIGRVPQIERP